MFKFRTMRADAEAVLPTLVQFDALAEPAFKLRADPARHPASAASCGGRASTSFPSS